MSSSNHLLLYLISSLLITLYLCPYDEAAFLTSPVAGGGEYFCDLGGTYANNTVFETNLNLLLSSLTTVTPTTAIFYDAKGEAPDQVFGLAACLGDHHRDCSECLCRACLRRLVRHTRRSCPNKKQATVVSRGCVLSYSIESLNDDRDDDGDDHRRQGVLPYDEISTIDHLEVESITSKIGIEEFIPEPAQSEPLFVLVTPPEEENVVVTAVEEEKEELPDSVVIDNDDRQLPVEILVVENQEEMILTGIDDEAPPESVPLPQPPPTLINDETPMTITPLSFIDTKAAEESEDFLTTMGATPTTYPTIIPSKKTFSPPNTEVPDEPIPSVSPPPLTEEETEPPLAPSTEEETKPPPPPLKETKPPPADPNPPQPKKRLSPSRTKRSPSPVPTASRSSARTRRRPKSKEEKNSSPVVVFKFLSVIAFLVIVYLLCSCIWRWNTASKRNLGKLRFQETDVPKGWGRSTFLNRRTRRE